MVKLALALAVVALGLGAYTQFGPKADEAEPPASAASVTALEGRVEALLGEVSSLQAALASELEAREQVQARAGKLEEEARLRDARLVALETKDGGAGGPLKTTELIVESPEGAMLLRLGATEDGGGEVEVFAKNGNRVTKLFARSDDDGELALYDEHGALRSNIGGNDDGGYANFYGAADTLAAYIGADTAKPSGYVGVYGADKKEIVGLYGNAKGGVISTRNLETGKQVVMIGAAPNNGMGFVGLGTDEGKPALALFVTKNGGQFKALNAAGEAATFIGVSANPAGNGLMYVCRKDGERLAEVGATTEGGGYMSLNNSKNERVLFMGASSGEAPGDGVLEVARKNGKLGVVLRGYSGGSSVRVYDNDEKVKLNLR